MNIFIRLRSSRTDRNIDYTVDDVYIYNGNAHVITVYTPLTASDSILIGVYSHYHSIG